MQHYEESKLCTRATSIQNCSATSIKWGFLANFLPLEPKLL